MKQVMSTLFFALVTLFLTGCGLASSPFASSPDVAQRCQYPNGPYCVLYKVTGDSTLKEASYLDSNAFRYSHIVSAAWQTAISFEAGNTAYLTGQNLTGEGNVACEIWINGERRAYQKSNKSYDIVICEAVIP